MNGLRRLEPGARHWKWLRPWSGRVGLALCVLVLGVAVFGAFFAPHDPADIIGVPYSPPSFGLPFGTDSLGRDVLSRALWGGRTVISLAVIATLSAYLVGGFIGLVAGTTRSLVDPVLMRAMDVLLAFPPLLLILVLATGAGTTVVTLVVAIAVVQIPGIARIIRAATLEVSVKSFVEAAVARGESKLFIAAREILPNISGTIAADAGPRLTGSILAIAGVTFLGVGLQPPRADWALMMTENRTGITLQPWGIVVPALLIAGLTVGLNLLGDSIARSVGKSSLPTVSRKQRRLRMAPWRWGVTSGMRRRGDRVVSQSGERVATTASKSSDKQLLTVDRLRVELESGAPIVDNLSFSVYRGEILGLVGESGSGKTTTALAVLGYCRPGVRIAGGSVSLEGRELLGLGGSELRRLRGGVVSYIPQDPSSSLNPSLRVHEQVAQIVKSHDTKGGVNELVRDVLERVHLPSDRSFQKRFPHQLSGGQQQRVTIAMALVCSPSLVVLDEPTTGLDVITQAHILREISRLRDETGVSMIYVSHDLAVVGAIADRIAVMYAGSIVEEGPTATVLTRPRHPYAHGLLSSAPDHVVARRLRGIPGVAVGVGERPQGCAFAPRCPQRTPRADAEMPPLEEIAPGHRVRCFEWQLTPEVVPESPIDGRALSVRGSPLLIVDGLQATHTTKTGTITAASDVSFAIEPGEVLALVGESGSGKTTIARCIAGLHSPDSGELLFRDRPLAATAKARPTETRRLIQIVFQNPYESLNPRRRVVEQLVRPAQQLRGLGHAAATREARGLLEQVRLPRALADQYPPELSGGERQRVAIARALIARPELLICDEITSALDTSVQAAILELLIQLQAELELALLVISHDLGVVASIASRVLVLERGAVCEEGRIDAILARPERPYTRALLEAAPTLPSSTETRRD